MLAATKSLYSNHLEALDFLLIKSVCWAHIRAYSECDLSNISSSMSHTA